MRRQRLVIPLILAIVIAACGGSNFARQLRLVLAASPPLIESLPLSPALKSGLITDFTGMADGAATLAECLSVAPDKSAKVMCVSNYQVVVESIIARGHFGDANNPRLNQILSLIRGIIASARIYYGAPAPTARAGQPPVTEKSIKAQVDELERLMKAQ